ncbi:hypothetical protein [Streptomyces sp. SID10815]|uniref:hypothetical protein n=1 Tax=Streptomyces sp. SID10815 TaxID=2706027 RepID=UPI0013C778BF|nr:hypothetical protein [Streptomyces sp. SID10815]NEA50490.1 hypothetical protein [Streptomyces sp. SID10815]
MPEMINESEQISTSPLGRLLALPAKGQPQRKQAIGAYLGMAACLVTTAGFTALRVEHDGAANTRALANAATLHGDAYSEKPQEGFESTYFDGAGGIAGVPLTEEQRKALIKEAERRGMDEDDAYALAYGDGSEAKRKKDGTVLVDTSHVALAGGPVYKRVTPEERSADTPSFKLARSAPDALSANPFTRPKKVKEIPAPPSRKPGKGQGAKSGIAPYYDEGRVDLDGNSDKHKFSDEVPGPVGDLIDILTPFSAWIGDLSQPGTTPTFDVQPRPDGGATVTASAQVSADLTVTAHVVAPPAGAQAADPVVTVKVTDTDSGAVLSKVKPETADGLEDVPRVAIGQVVDAVIAASEATREDDTSVADAVQDSGDDALEDLVDTAPATAQG